MNSQSVAPYRHSHLFRLPWPNWKPLPEGQVRQLRVRYERGPVRARKGTLIKNPRDLWRIFKDLAQEPVEVYRVGFLDASSRLMAYEDIARGAVERLLEPHPREVFCSAIHLRASGLVAMRSCPCVDPEPIDTDFTQARVLRTVGRLLGIELVDYVIIGESGWYSFHEEFWSKESEE